MLQGRTLFRGPSLLIHPTIPPRAPLLFQASIVGGVMDPIADKILITVVTIAMGSSGLVPLWLAGLVIGRDVFLFSTSLYIRYVSLLAHSKTMSFATYWDFCYPSVVVRPTVLSKANTVAQIGTLFWSLALPVAGVDATVALHIIW